METSRSSSALRATALLLGGIICALLLHACGGGKDAALQPIPDSATPPTDISELQELLDSELERLGVDQQRTGSIAPSAGNAVFDLQATVTTVVPGEQADVSLRWTERLVGDYDQNGLVNASDLVPLAQNFGETVSYLSAVDTDGIEGWPTGLAYDPNDAVNWRLARIDGNMDGVINAADVTPIAQHWQQSLSGYRVYRQFGAEGEAQLLPDPADVDSQQSVSRTASLPADNALPVSYSFSDNLTDAGEYLYYVAAYDPSSDGEGPPSRGVRPVLNIPPLAVLSADQLEGPAPLSVQFDGSGSSDSDGEIVLYEFDLDGDGEIDRSSSEPFASRVYGGGSTVVSLRVTDDRGGQGFSQLLVDVDDVIIPWITADKTEDSIPVDFTFSAEESMSELPIVQYTWYVDTQSKFQQRNSEPTDYSPDINEVGEHTIYLVLRDDEGAERTAKLEIEVFPAPLAIASSGQQDWWRGDEIRVFSTGSIAGGGGYLWDVDADWIPDSSPDVWEEDFAGALLKYTPTEAGQLQVTLRRYDDFGKYDDHNLIFKIIEPLQISLEHDALYQEQGGYYLPGQAGTLSFTASGNEDFIEGWRIEFLDLPKQTIEYSNGSEHFEYDEIWENSGTRDIRCSIVQSLSEETPPSMQYEISVTTLPFVPEFSADAWIKLSSEFSFDASASKSGGVPVTYSWDFDSDGVIDETGVSTIVNHNFSSGTHDVTMYMHAPSGYTRSVTHQIGSWEGHVTLIRNDGGSYDANHAAITDDLDTLGLSWSEVVYSPGIAAIEGSTDRLRYIWYRGGPGDATEPAPYTTMWTTNEIDDYLELMQAGKSVLLMSQSHGKEPDNFGETNLWETGLGFTLLPNSVPADEWRHPWALSVRTDEKYGFGGSLGYLTGSPQNLSYNGSRILSFASSNNTCAERLDNEYSSHKIPTQLLIQDCLQLCGIGYSDFSGWSTWQGFSLGTTELVLGSDLARYSYGNTLAPDANVGFWPNYQHVGGPGRLYVVGYPWAQTVVSNSSSGDMTRAEMLQNILGWLVHSDD